MDLMKAIEELAINFEACNKTLSAMGDETRQHIILEMMRMDYQGSRVPDITKKNESLPPRGISSPADIEGCRDRQDAQGRHHDVLLS